MSSRSSRVAITAVVAVVVLAGIGRCAEVEEDGGGVAQAPVTSSQQAPAPVPPPSSPAPVPERSPSLAPPEAAPAPAVDPLVPAARSALVTLDVKGRAPKTGYDRDLFGQAWSDDVSVEFGHNGCDTRNDVLQRDLQEVVFRPGTRDCVELTGVLIGPYTGERIDFVRGRETSSKIHIDHVVALNDAWQKGAQQLPEDRLREMANDPLNLLAVAGHANQAKGAGDAATWLPPRKDVRCGYVSRQILVKERYALWVTPAEREAMERVLSGCG